MQKPSSAPSKSSSFRPEIQGLRALAVGLVLIYHLWPNRMSGGYIGVDMFFVISGFLITSHLFKEISTTGTIRLRKFWSRRVMRLLPLAFLVILVSAAVLFLFMPQTSWVTNVRHLIGSAFYIENWLLAFDSVDYSANATDASMAQHYWTLSTEEQFYVLLPLLFLAGVWFIRKRKDNPATVRKALITVLAIVAVASFVFSVWFTNYEPAQAYFVTPTRFWQFTVGGLIALIPTAVTLPDTFSNILSYIGLAAVVYTGFVYSDSTDFPGYAALLPTLGTALFIRYGTHQPWIGSYWWASQRPFTRIGDWSYAIYLWHWPMIVVATTLLPVFNWKHKLVIFVVTILISALSQKLIEDPLRFAPTFKKPKYAFTFMGAGIAVITVAAWTPPQLFLDTVKPEQLQSRNCTGAQALLDSECTEEEIFDVEPLVSPAYVYQEVQKRPYPQCDENSYTNDVEDPEPCYLGTDPSEADLTIAVFGDSHARSWLPLFDEVGKEQNIAIQGWVRAACRPMGLRMNREEDNAEARKDIACHDFVDYASQKIADDDSIDTVVHASISEDDAGFDEDGKSSYRVNDKAIHALWKRWDDADKDIVVMAELPFFGDMRIPECVEQAAGDLKKIKEECSRSYGDANKRRSNLVAASQNTNIPTHVYDPTPAVCRDGRCYGLLGGLVTYIDHSHISEDFSRSYQPSFTKFLKDEQLTE